MTWVITHTADITDASDTGRQPVHVLNVFYGVIVAIATFACLDLHIDKKQHDLQLQRVADQTHCTKEWHNNFQRFPRTSRKKLLVTRHCCRECLEYIKSNVGSMREKT